MSTSTVLIEPPSTPAPPTPEQIDALAEKYNRFKALKNAAASDFDDVEEEATRLVNDWGIVVPKA